MRKKPRIKLKGLPSAKTEKEQFQQNDFTMRPSKTSPLAKDERTAQIYKNVEKLSKKIFRETWLANLKEAGMEDSPLNFSKDDPLTLLTNQNEQFFSSQAAAILAEPNEQTLEIVTSLFLETCGEVLCGLYIRYAEEHKVDVDDIDDKIFLPIVWEVVQAYLAEIYNYLAELQSIPEIIDVLKTNRTQEDFNEGVAENHSKIDFDRKWTHSRTKTGPVMSFEELCENVEGLDDEAKQDAIERKIWEAAGGRDEDKEQLDYLLLKEALIKCASDEKDVQIIEMKENKLTDEDIAKRLGFANHSAVAKRIAKIYERYHKEYKKG